MSIIGDIFSKWLEAMEHSLLSDLQNGSPEAAFGRYLLTSVGLDCSAPFPLASPSSEINPTAPTLAVVGYAIAESISTQPTVTKEQWIAGVKLLAKRDPYPDDRQTFPFNPAVLTGLAIAIRALQGDSSVVEISTWFCGVLRTIHEHPLPDVWAEGVRAFVCSIFGVAWQQSFESRLEHLTALDLALAVCLARMSPPVALSGWDDIDVGNAQNELLKHQLYAPPECSSIARTATLYAGLRISAGERLASELSGSQIVAANTSKALVLLEDICRKFPRFVAQLEKPYRGRTYRNSRDEYDVQHLLHAILLLHFRDVRDEEWNPSYGGTSSRVDFLLKQERVIVETKMTRKSLNDQEIVSQSAEDKERYKTHPSADWLVCFVFDPDGHCKNPAAIEDDLAEEVSKPKVRVFVSPHGI